MLNRTNSVGNGGHAAQHDRITSRLLNVLDYGAKGDGSTNDTSALQAAITDAEILGRVVLPKGRFIYNQPIVLHDVSLVGSGWGTILDYRGSGNGIILGDLSGSTLYEGSQVADFILEGYSSQASANGLAACNAAHIAIKQVQVRGFGSGSGIVLQDAVVSALLEDCFCFSNSIGLYLYKTGSGGYVNAVRVVGGEYARGNVGIQVGTLNAVSASSIANSIVIRDSVIEANVTGIGVSQGHTIALHDIYFEAMTSEAVKLGTAATAPNMIDVRNCSVYNTPVAVDALAVENIMMERCYLHYNTPVGVKFHSGALTRILRDNFVYSGNSESVTV